MKIAYLSSRVTLPGSPTRRSDAFEHDYMMDALSPAFAALGMSLHDLAWDDPDVDWSSFDAAIIGTTWDYWNRIDEFLATLERIGTVTALFNSAALVRWNSRKTYLKEMEAKGAELIPTLWIDALTPELAAAAFDELGSDDLVFKRQIGAGAADQHRSNAPQWETTASSRHMAERSEPSHRRLTILPRPIRSSPRLTTRLSMGGSIC